MDLGSLFHSVAGLLDRHTRDNDTVDTDGLLGQVGSIFRQHGYDGPGYQGGQAGGGSILPASQDPMGDPADQGSGNILPASQDPLGDPADQPR